MSWSSIIEDASTTLMALNPGKPPIEASDVGEPYDGQPSKHKPETKVKISIRGLTLHKRHN